MILERLVVKLIGDGTSYNKMLDAATAQADIAVTKINRIGTSIKNVGDKATRTGAILTASLTAPLLAAGAASVKAAVDFNRLVGDVEALSIGPERILQLKSSTQDLAVSVGKSTGEMAKGLFQVVSAYGDSADTISSLEANARAAVAGTATVTEAIDLTSAVTKGFGEVSTEATKKVTDLALKTNELGQTSFSQLAKNMGKVIPLAAKLTVSQEELFNVFATATGVTGNTAEVSTQLRGALAGLLAPTADMASLYETLGIESGEALIKQHGLAGAIRLIVQESERTGNPLQKYLSSIEGQTLAYALAGAQADTYDEKLQKIRNAAGATDEAFKKQTEGVNKSGFSFDTLSAKSEVLRQKIGDKLLPVVSNLFDHVEKLLLPMADWISNNQALTANILTLVAAMGPLLIILGQTTKAVGLLHLAFGGLTKAVIGTITFLAGFVSLPVVIVTAIAAMIAAVFAFGGSFNTLVRIVKATFETNLDLLIAFSRAARRMFTALGGFLVGKFTDIFSIDFVKALISGLGLATEKLIAWGTFAAAKLRSLFTGSETGSVQDFLKELGGDLGTGAGAETLGQFSDVLKNIATEEFERFKDLDSTKESGKLVQEGVAVLKEEIPKAIDNTKQFIENNQQLKDIKEGIKELVDQGAETVQEDVLIVKPLGLR